MGCGIYRILNIKNGKTYIGSSINIKKREWTHLWMLKNNSHDNNFLQNSYNKFGSNCFIFEVIEVCDESMLIERENFYIEKFKSNDMNFGYNLATVNEFRRNNYNDEVKIKISKTNLAKNKNFTKFSLTNIETNEEHVFESLVDSANYLINSGHSKGTQRNTRMCISNCLRGIKLNNGKSKSGSIRKTCYKHNFKIIN